MQGKATLAEEVEDRISGLEDKIHIKENNRRTLRQKTQELQKEYT
jgi:chaperonin cofactor prefoldin